MATLKISELSVGDWVRYGGRDYQVKEIDGFCNRVSLVGNKEQRVESIKSIHPIPITAEMLESNGFVDKGSRLFPYEREWRGGKSTVNICSFDEELWFVDVEFRDGPTCMSDIPLIYIHQLQHILRLIEVDKEINL
jgi:hypothetical protein